MLTQQAYGGSELLHGLASVADLLEHLLEGSTELANLSLT